MLPTAHVVCAAQDEPFLRNLLTWFRHDNGDACDCAMLDLLRKLAQQQGVSSKLCSLGVIAILRSLQENGSPSVQRSADRTLTAVVQSDVTPVLQPLSPNSVSARYPRSTCQSNSPSVPHAQHQHRHLERVGEMHGRLSGCSTRSHKHIASSAVDSAASQAFGSQQGKTYTVYGLKAAVSSAQHSRVRLAAQKLMRVQKCHLTPTSSVCLQTQPVAMWHPLTSQQLV